MTNRKDEALRNALRGGEKPILPIAKKPTVEVWKELSPGLYVNQVTGNKLSSNDFDLYRTHLEWSGIGMIIEKF